MARSRSEPDWKDIGYRAQHYVTGQADTIARAVESVGHTAADPAFITAQLQLEVFRQASQQLAWLDREGRKLPNRRALDEWDIELLRATAAPYVPITKRMLDGIVTLAKIKPRDDPAQGAGRQSSEVPWTATAAGPSAEIEGPALRKPIHVPMPKDYPGGHGVEPK